MIAVFEAYAQESIRLFQDSRLEPVVQHGIGATFKAVMTQAAHSALYALSERCGARGLYAYNHIIESQLDCRAVSIAEGDTLALCISTFYRHMTGRLLTLNKMTRARHRAVAQSIPTASC